MKKLNLVSVGAALLLALGFAAPASAQMTYNFGGDGTGPLVDGNCDFPPATCTVTGSTTVAKNLTITGWSAASGANFVAAEITNQNSSGIGMSAPGETTDAPQHAIDNSSSLELVMLNFGSNKVVLTGLSTGWAQQDADLSVLRWIGGAAGPTMTTTTDFRSLSAAQLTAAGWAIMSSHDMDGTSNTTYSTTYGTRSANTALNVLDSNSSSWWIVSSYFSGGFLGNADSTRDYFKLLSVSATCVGNTSGGACNASPPPGVPEPASLALAAVALAGIGFSRRKKAK